MILVDANLLIYAHMAGPQHEAARAWLDERLNGTAQVGLPWASLLAFTRIVTNPRAFEKPQTMLAAWSQVEAWLGCKRVWTPPETDEHAALVKKMLGSAGSRPNLVPDAHLAALAVGHGLTLCSSDADFSRFPSLRWENPLEQ